MDNNTNSGSSQNNLSNSLIELDESIDDLPMSSQAFRAYIHILRMGKIPSARDLGYHCWPELKESTQKQKAEKAIAELKSFGVIK